MRSNILFKGKKRNSFNRGNYHSYLLALLLVCLFVGALLIYNASSTYAFKTFNNEFYFVINHVSWIILSLSFFAIIQVVPTSLIKSLSLPLFLLTVFFLFFVILPTPFSVKALGARRWLLLNPDFLPKIPLLGRLSFQPSELVKLAVMLALPNILLFSKHLISVKDRVFRYLFYLLIPVFLVFLEPDLKTAFLIFIIGISLLFVYGVDLKYFLYAGPLIASLLLVLVLFSPYRMERLKTFLGGGDIQESSYHANQINIALGSGGWVGLGLGQSRQKNEYLPEVVGDSIFAIYGEEFGFLGSIILISLLLSIIYILFKITMSLEDPGQRMSSTALLTWYSVQTFLNLGAISGVIPLTGVPLPLISYGGSSLVFIVSGFAVVYKYYRESV